MTGDYTQEAPFLAVEALGISYPSVDAPPVAAVSGLSFAVQRGEFVSLLGPSGCGKSSVLRCLSGLIPASCGTRLLAGDSYDGLLPALGYLTQTDHLLPWYTVADNVAMGLRLRGLGKAARQDIARSWLHRVGLHDVERLYPHELSGGMKKRVSIAQVLATKPEILFLDEPFAALDAITKGKMKADLLEICEKENLTILYVTHDIAEAIELSDRVLLMGGRPGTIKAEFPVAMKRPRELSKMRFEADFLALERAMLAALTREVEGTGGCA